MIDQILDTILNHCFRSTCSRGNENTFDPLKPTPVDILSAINQIGGDLIFDSDFPESLTVRTVLASEHQNQIHILREHLHRFLAILCGIADILFGRADDLWVSFSQF